MPSVCSHIDRLEASGLVTRRQAERDRRRVDLEVTAEGRRVLKVIRSKRTAWLSARLGKLPDDRPRRRRRGHRAARRRSWSSRNEPRHRQRHGAHLHEPSPSLQLPAVFLRAGRVHQRHMDAERRPGMVRRAEHALAARGRHPRGLPVRPVRAVRPLRWRDRGQARSAQGAHRHAGGVHGHRGAARRPHAQRSRDRVGGVLIAGITGHDHGARQPRAAGVHHPDGRTRRAAQRRGAELQPLQRLAHRRTRHRRRSHRRRRRRNLLPHQRDQLSRRPRRALGDARATSCFRFARISATRTCCADRSKG